MLGSLGSWPRLHLSHNELDARASAIIVAAAASESRPDLPRGSTVATEYSTSVYIVNMYLYNYIVMYLYHSVYTYTYIHIHTL